MVTTIPSPPPSHYPTPIKAPRGHRSVAAYLSRRLTLGINRMMVTISQERIVTNITGGCMCGQVRYTITAEPSRSWLCHCRDCQRRSGSSFEPLMSFPAESVGIQGNLKSFDMLGGSGQVLHRRFCPNCGSGVFAQSAARPGSIVVLAGTLDDPAVFAPTIEVFCDDAQPWVHAGSERQRFPKMPT